MGRYNIRVGDGTPRGPSVWTRVVLYAVLLIVVLWLQAQVKDTSAGCYRLFESRPLEAPSLVR